MALGIGRRGGGGGQPLLSVQTSCVQRRTTSPRWMKYSDEGLGVRVFRGRTAPSQPVTPLCAVLPRPRATSRLRRGGTPPKGPTPRTGGGVCVLTRPAASASRRCRHRRCRTRRLSLQGHLSRPPLPTFADAAPVGAAVSAVVVGRRCRRRRRCRHRHRCNPHRHRHRHRYRRHRRQPPSTRSTPALPPGATAVDRLAVDASPQTRCGHRRRGRPPAGRRRPYRLRRLVPHGLLFSSR